MEECGCCSQYLKLGQNTNIDEMGGFNWEHERIKKKMIPNKIYFFPTSNRIFNTYKQ